MFTESYTYKNGDNGESLAAAVSWSSETVDIEDTPKPIGMKTHRACGQGSIVAVANWSIQP